MKDTTEYQMEHSHRRRQAQGARRRTPWLILVSVPLALLALLLFSMQRGDVAQAADITVCNPGGTHATIQAAVNAANPGDVIKICPGAYAESVDLAGMPVIGDITLIANGGPVNIEPPSGPAIFFSTEFFTGHVTIDGIHVTSPDDSGLQIGEPGLHVMKGPVTLIGVTAEEANGDGIVIVGSDYMEFRTDVQIVDSAAISNGQSGIVVLVYTGTVEISGTLAAHNGTEGVDVVNTSGDVHVRGSSAEYNGAIGFSMYAVYQGASIFVENSTAHHNGQILLAPGVLGAGFRLHSGDDESCIDPSNITVTRSSAYMNAGYGFELTSYRGDVHVAESTADENAYDGFSIGAYCGGSALVQTSSADSNGWWEDFKGSGFSVFSSASTTILDSSAENNDCDGISAGARMDVFGRESSNCGYQGGDVVAVSAAEVVNVEIVDLASIVYISNTTVISNVDNGITVSAGNYVTVENVSALRNGHEGVEFLNTLSEFAPVGARIAIDGVATLDQLTWVLNSLILDNVGYGVEYEHVTRLFPDDVLLAAAVPTDPGNFAQRNIICDNGKGGLAVIQKFEEVIFDPFVLAAVANPYSVDALGNWWGDDSGPFHSAKNGTGLGNQVVDASNGISGTGDVQFDPWIDSIVGAASPDPTAVGVPTNINFQFSDDPGTPTYFLGRGVGNLNDTPPFTMTAQGGVLQGAGGSGQTIHEFITTADGRVLAILSPSTEGLTPEGYAVVTLQGPCMPPSQIRILVVQPGIDVQKTPDLQVAPAGSDVSFTIEISNTGDLTLTQVAVADALAPACAMVAGTIPDLAPHTGYSYQCAAPSVAAGFVNEAVASGQPEFPGTVLPTVVATDTAQVQVVSIDVQKTPDLQVAPAGDDVTFTIEVSNTGELPLTQVAVADALAPACAMAAGTIPDLAPHTGYSYQCIAPAVAAGFVNEAVASGVPQTEFPAPTVVATDTAQVQVVSIDVQKTPDLQVAPAGGDVTFTVEVSNTGELTLTQVTVADALAPGCAMAAGTIPDLAPHTGYSYQCVQPSVAAGFVNEAVASGLPQTAVQQPPTVVATDTAQVQVVSIDVQKTPDLQAVPAGDDVTFTIEVSNTGELPLTLVAVADVLAPACAMAAGTIPDLAPHTGYSYQCVQPGVAVGFVNEAVASATSQLAPATLTAAEATAVAQVQVVATDTAQVHVVSIAVQKTPDVQVVRAGDDVTFTIAVSNTGELPLTQVAVADALAPNCDIPAGSIPALAPSTGYSYQCTAPGVAAGFVNEAVASATAQIGIDTLTAAVAANGAPQVVATDTAQVQVASIVLTKTVSVPPADCTLTDVITVTLSESIPQANVVYCYTAENTGEVSLDVHDLVDDPLGQLLNDVRYPLAPGSTFVFTASATITATTVNTATWTGFYGTELSVSASDTSSAKVIIVQAPTALPEEEQPLAPVRIFVPLVNR